MTTVDKKVHLNSLIKVRVGKLISAENIWSLQSCDVIKVKKEFSYRAWKLVPFKCIFVNLTGAGASGPWLFTMSVFELDRKLVQCATVQPRRQTEKKLYF